MAFSPVILCGAGLVLAKLLSSKLIKEHAADPLISRFIQLLY